MPYTAKQKSWKTIEKMVRPDLGARMDQQDANHVVGDDDDDDDDDDESHHTVV
jgi:type IV secretory pathway VirD2 relaxase